MTLPVIVNIESSAWKVSDISSVLVDPLAYAQPRWNPRYQARLLTGDCKLIRGVAKPVDQNERLAPFMEHRRPLED